MRVQCPKGRCRSERWNPTGRVDANRRGRLAAVVQCQKCGYRWLSTLPEALNAAKVLLESQGQEMPTLARRQVDPPAAGFILPLGRPAPKSSFSSVRDVVQDFKAKAAGGDE